MKRYILPILILAALGACQDENEVRYSVDPQLQPYVDTFYNEAAERGVVIPKNLVAELNEVVQGISTAEIDNGQYYLHFNATMFDGFKAAGVESQIEANIYGKLAEVFRKKSFMTKVATDKESYFDEVFN